MPSPCRMAGRPCRSGISSSASRIFPVRRKILLRRKRARRSHARSLPTHSHRPPGTCAPLPRTLSARRNLPPQRNATPAALATEPFLRATQSPSMRSALTTRKKLPRSKTHARRSRNRTIPARNAAPVPRSPPGENSPATKRTPIAPATEPLPHAQRSPRPGSAAATLPRGENSPPQRNARPSLPQPNRSCAQRSPRPDFASALSTWRNLPPRRNAPHHTRNRTVPMHNAVPVPRILSTRRNLPPQRNATPAALATEPFPHATQSPSRAHSPPGEAFPPQRNARPSLPRPKRPVQSLLAVALHRGGPLPLEKNLLAAECMGVAPAAEALQRIAHGVNGMVVRVHIAAGGASVASALKCTLRKFARSDGATLGVDDNLAQFAQKAHAALHAARALRAASARTPVHAGLQGRGSALSHTTRSPGPMRARTSPGQLLCA